jgi:zinc protease
MTAALLLAALAQAAPAPSSAFALPPARAFEHASGAIVTVVPLRELPLLSIRIVAEGGARLEPADQGGLASFAALLAEEGPAGMTRAQFLQALDRLGAEFGAEGSLDDVTLSLDLMARDLEPGLLLLFAAALAPGFDDDAVARAKERTIGQIVAAREDEGALAREAFLARLFPDHRYGRPLAGTPESVATFTRDGTLAFQRAAFAPARLRVIVVGDVDPEAADRAVAAAAKARGAELGAAKERAPRPFQPGGRAGVPWPRRELVLVHKPGVIQPQVLFGCRGPDATRPDRTALRAANVPFGSGFTSWLVDRLRVDLGLTYSASSRIETWAEGSAFLVSTFTKSETIDTLLTEAFALLDRLHGGLDDAALERARLALATRTVQGMETTAGVAGLVTQEELLRLGSGSVGRFSRELGALTTDALKQAIAANLPDSAHVLCVVVGDEAAIGERLRALGEVTTVDYETMQPIGNGAAK